MKANNNMELSSKPELCDHTSIAAHEIATI